MSMNKTLYKIVEHIIRTSKPAKSNDCPSAKEDILSMTTTLLDSYIEPNTLKCILFDALRIANKRETAKPMVVLKIPSSGFNEYRCPDCKRKVNCKDSYCRYCGCKLEKP